MNRTLLERAALRGLPRSIALAATWLICALLAASCGGQEGADERPRALAPESQAASSTPLATVPAAEDEVRLEDLDPEALRRVAKEYLARNPKKAAKWRRRMEQKRVEISKNGEPITLPTSYPKDVPLHPIAEPTRYVSSPLRGATTTMRVAQSPGAVYDFYVGEINAAGWEIQSDDSEFGLTVVNATKGDRALSVSIQDKDGTTEIILMERSQPSADPVD